MLHTYHETPAVCHAVYTDVMADIRIVLGLNPDLHTAITQRAATMGISRTAWITRALTHALEHANASGEPQALKLPWSALL